MTRKNGGKEWEVGRQGGRGRRYLAEYNAPSFILLPIFQPLN